MAVTDRSQTVLKECKPTAKAVEELSESSVHVKTPEFVKKQGVIKAILIRP